MERRPIPITEQLPDHGVNVLAYSDGVGWWQANYFPSDDGSDPNDGMAGWYLLRLENGPIQSPITHWLPMPRSPKE